MALDSYFAALIKKLESDEDVVSNAGKDAEGFYKPRRAVVLRNLNMLKDLHANRNASARAMLRSAWENVVQELPEEWLVLDPTQKKELKEMLG